MKKIFKVIARGIAPVFSKTPKQEQNSALRAIAMFLLAVGAIVFGFDASFLGVDQETTQLAAVVVAAFTAGWAWVKKLINESKE